MAFISFLFQMLSTSSNILYIEIIFNIQIVNITEQFVDHFGLICQNLIHLSQLIQDIVINPHHLCQIPVHLLNPLVNIRLFFCHFQEL